MELAVFCLDYGPGLSIRVVYDSDETLLVFETYEHLVMLWFCCTRKSFLAYSMLNLDSMVVSLCNTWVQFLCLT